MACTHRILIITILMLFPAVSARSQELMPPTSAGWAGFFPRPDSAPAVVTSSGGSGYALEIHGNRVPSVYGGWRTRIQGLSGGAYYRFRTRALPLDIASPRESVTILLRWRGAFGDEVAPDYVWQYSVQTDETLLFDRVIQAPPGTTAVDVELVLQWAPNGVVRFDALSFAPSAPPAPRPVKAAAVYYRPSGTANGLESVQRAARYGEEVAALHRPDVMVFGEMLNVIGAPGTYDAKAETVPGPSTDVMAALARSYNVNVVFGLLERQDRFLYNTAVLLDRAGNVAGKYRKMQLPLSEASVGITPGTSVPVFDTDVGRVALLICQDIAFPEPAREAAIRGAEMLLVPIWGGKSIAVRARAIEQSMYVLASGYDYVSDIVNPLGAVLDAVDTLAQPGVAVATIDLARRFREDWVGDWRDSSNKERRVTAYTATEPPPGEEPPPPPVDTAPPAVSVTSPASGATVTGVVSLTANASDNVGVTIVRFFVNGGALGADDTAAPYATSWDSRTAADGSHTLTATAFDAAGNSASASVTVNVSNAPPADLREIVIRASGATRLGGAWRLVADQSAAGGTAATHPNADMARVAAPLPAPMHYVDFTFDAEGGRPYRLWIRGRADDNAWYNDSVYLQFSGTVGSNGEPIMRIGTTAAGSYNLEDAGGAGVSGWGWQDNGYGGLGPLLTFERTGPQTIRMQTREDGLRIDQIVLSSGTYLTSVPAPSGTTRRSSREAQLKGVRSPA